MNMKLSIEDLVKVKLTKREAMKLVKLYFRLYPEARTFARSVVKKLRK